MSAEPKALADGRRRYQDMRRRQAVKRVREFQRWLKRGSPLGRMPAIPSSADFRIAKRQ